MGNSAGTDATHIPRRPRVQMPCARHNGFGARGSGGAARTSGSALGITVALTLIKRIASSRSPTRRSASLQHQGSTVCRFRVSRVLARARSGAGGGAFSRAWSGRLRSTCSLRGRRDHRARSISRRSDRSHKLVLNGPRTACGDWDTLVPLACRRSRHRARFDAARVGHVGLKARRLVEHNRIEYCNSGRRLVKPVASAAAQGTSESSTFFASLTC